MDAERWNRIEIYEPPPGIRLPPWADLIDMTPDWARLLLEASGECRSCGGQGRQWSTCLTCGGRGKGCGTCAGMGKVLVTCAMCRGSGVGR